MSRRRHMISLFLVVVYTATVFSSLFSLAGAAFGHDFTGSCAEDCATCGCDPVKSASRACCCWATKSRKAHARDHGATRACCRPGQGLSVPVVTCPPCGGTTAVVATWGGFDQIPFQAAAVAPVFSERLLSESIHHCRPDRWDAPPVPPPKSA